MHPTISSSPQPARPARLPRLGRGLRDAGDRFAAAVTTRLALREERGDVPGWVLITLMTAGLVLLIWGLAGPALERIFNDAINRVSGI